MSRKEGNGGTDITFVVTTNPLASSAANKKRVRSVAALKSWPERRKKTFAHSQSKISGHHGGFVLDLPEPVASSSGGNAAKKRKLETQFDVSNTLSRLEPQHELREIDDEPLFEKCTRATGNFCGCAHCRAERRYSGQSRQIVLAPVLKRPRDDRSRPRLGKADLVLITPPSSPEYSPLTIMNRKAEPFNQYPVPYQAWFDYILHHMMNVFAPRGWPALKISDAEGRRWEWFMTQHALAEPALFYVRLLFATGDLLRLKCVSPDLSYWIQGQAVQSINEALSDPKRATSDALILAVGRIALHESLYGDKNAAATVHRPAQKRMIVLRGGMKALPFPELVKRLMRWSDTVMSKLSGTERLLEDDEGNQNFSMKEHVDVLEKWVPTEGQELQKRIKISDLLSPDEPSGPP